MNLAKDKKNCKRLFAYVNYQQKLKNGFVCTYNVHFICTFSMSVTGLIKSSKRLNKKRTD